VNKCIPLWIYLHIFINHSCIHYNYRVQYRYKELLKERCMSMKSMDVMEQLDVWLRMLIEAEGADLHIKSDSAIHARVKSDYTFY